MLGLLFLFAAGAGRVGRGPAPLAVGGKPPEPLPVEGKLRWMENQWSLVVDPCPICGRQHVHSSSVTIGEDGKSFNTKRLSHCGDAFLPKRMDIGDDVIVHLTDNETLIPILGEFDGKEDVTDRYRRLIANVSCEMAISGLVPDRFPAAPVAEKKAAEKKVKVANVIGSSTHPPDYNFKGSMGSFAGFYELRTRLDFFLGLPCCFEGCIRPATVGAHLWVRGLHPDYCVIAPACRSCNLNRTLDLQRTAGGKLVYPGRLKRGTELAATKAPPESKIRGPGLARYWPRKARDPETLPN